MAYDSRHHETLLFGGYDDSLRFMGDTWVFDGGKRQWRRLTPATSPSPRGSAAIAFDAKHGEIVLFGGHDFSRSCGFNDTWTWDGVTWTRRFPATRPPCRDVGRMVFDAKRGNVVLVESDGSGQRDDTWLWDGNNWKQAASSAGGRVGPAMAYDATTGKVVLFGGVLFYPDRAFGDTLTWDGRRWTVAARQSAGGPHPQGSAAMIYDDALGTPVLFGGIFRNREIGYRGTWRWDGRRWVRLPTVASPPAVVGPEMAYDTDHHVGVLFGGRGVRGLSDATWLLSPVRAGRGYWLVARDGGVFSFGDARFYGSTGSKHLNQPIVAMARTLTRKGYWLVGSDGGVFSFGDAHFFGSTGSMHLNQPIVAIVATPTGGGYWLIARDGGVFSFGDAHFRGSTGAIELSRPIVGAAATASGGGYWLVASDGGIFSFGDAKFYGSAAGRTPDAPVVGMTAAPNGKGYRLATRNGNVINFGNVPNISASQPATGTVVKIATSPTGKGYTLFAGDGGVFTAGDARFFGSTGSMHLNQPIVGAATT